MLMCVLSVGPLVPIPSLMTWTMTSWPRLKIVSIGGGLHAAVAAAAEAAARIHRRGRRAVRHGRGRRGRRGLDLGRHGRPGHRDRSAVGGGPSSSSSSAAKLLSRPGSDRPSSSGWLLDRHRVEVRRRFRRHFLALLVVVRLRPSRLGRGAVAEPVVRAHRIEDRTPPRRRSSDARPSPCTSACRRPRHSVRRRLLAFALLLGDALALRLGLPLVAGRLSSPWPCRRVDALALAAWPRPRRLRPRRLGQLGLGLLRLVAAHLRRDVVGNVGHVGSGAETTVPGVGSRFDVDAGPEVVEFVVLGGSAAGSSRNRPASGGGPDGISTGSNGRRPRSRPRSRLPRSPRPPRSSRRSPRSPRSSRRSPRSPPLKYADWRRRTRAGSRSGRSRSRRTRPGCSARC